MTIRVIVTVIYSKESHLDIQSFENILLKMNHTFAKIEHKIGPIPFQNGTFICRSLWTGYNPHGVSKPSKSVNAGHILVTEFNFCKEKPNIFKI